MAAATPPSGRSAAVGAVAESPASADSATPGGNPVDQGQAVVVDSPAPAAGGESRAANPSARSSPTTGSASPRRPEVAAAGGSPSAATSGARPLAVTLLGLAFVVLAWRVTRLLRRGG